MAERKYIWHQFCCIHVKTYNIACNERTTINFSHSQSVTIKGRIQVVVDIRIKIKTNAFSQKPVSDWKKLLTRFSEPLPIGYIVDSQHNTILSLTAPEITSILITNNLHSSEETQTSTLRTWKKKTFKGL